MSNFDFGGSDPSINTTTSRNTATLDGDGEAFGVRAHNAEIRRVFSANIRPLIDSSGISQRDLADKAGIKEFAMSRMVRGLLTPKVSDVAAIAEALEVSPDDIVPGMVRENSTMPVRFHQEILGNGKIYMRFEGALEPKDAKAIIEAVQSAMGI